MSSTTRPANSPSTKPAAASLLAEVSALSVLNALSAHLAVIDNRGTIVAINDAWTRFARENGSTSATTGVGCNYLEACRKALLPENYESGFEALHGIEQVLKGEIAEFELEYPCHSPETRRWFLMRCTPIGNGSHAVICHLNITGKKLSEERLQKREDELEAFHLIHREVAAQIELGPVIATILTQVYRIIQPDLAMLFLLEGDNLVLQKAVPALPDTFCHDTEAHQVGQCLCGLAVQLRKPVFSYDITTDGRCSRNECKDAGLRSFGSIPLVNGQAVYGCIGISSKLPRDFSIRRNFLEAAAHDITLSLKNALLYQQLKDFSEDMEKQLREQRRLEQVIVQNQKLEAIGHLAGGIAHDFNNILAAIMGYSELVLKKTADPEARDYLQGVLKACHRAKDLIQQILTFSRKSDANLVPIDLHLILKESLSLIKASLPSNITVADHLDSLRPAAIRGNPTQLQRVFMNLCTNGAQAMQHTGGMLIVKLSLTEVDHELHERCPELKLDTRYIVLSVRDTGTGIAAEHMGSIFEPYFTTKPAEKGTGLGLAVVHGIVKNHNGIVLVDSIPQHGTTFSLFFPVLELPAVLAESPERSTAHGGAGHILIVDDEAPILFVQQKALEGRGYTTTCSQFAKEAITLFRKAPYSYDLVLCDLTMPDIAGDVLARKIKDIRADIPIILCTGHSTEMLHGIDTSHIDRILQKPISQAELSETLQEVLNSRIPLNR